MLAGPSMAIFEVRSRHNIPLRHLSKGRTFDDEAMDALREHTDFGKRGCYVFGISYPTGSLPIYVGKTEEQSFASRAFSNDKLLRIQNFMNSQLRDYKLVIYLISQTESRGAPNIRDIDVIESWLIYHARQRNAELVNKRKVANSVYLGPTLQIVYLHNNFPRGNAPSVVRDFKQMMGIA